MRLNIKTNLKLLSLIFLLFSLSQSALQLCPNSYFFDYQHCQTCQLNCICKIENTCDSCINGYTFYKGQCIQCPQAIGGTIYGQCSGCCSSQQGTILACTDCTSVVGMYSFLFAGRCILSDGCFEVDSYGFCSECRNGYYQINNLCYSCDASCATCTDITNCLTCANGYFWTISNGGLCTLCPNGCSSCDLTGVCSTCLNQYFLYTNHCLQCPTNCLTCTDGSSCTSCLAGILVSNLCIQCTDTPYGGSAGCLTCSQNNNFIQCDSCADTYFLDSSTGVCRLCSDYITGASRCRDQNTPTQCQDDSDSILPNRYYLVGISCVTNTKSCKQMIDVQGNCATCYPGYILSLTSQCVQCSTVSCLTQNLTVVSNICTCTQCKSGFYLPSGSATCSACSTNFCSVCAGNTCSACKTGYYLSAPGTCSPTTVTNCLVAATATTCTTCSNGYYAGSDHICYICQSNCLTCTTPFTCSSCANGYYLHSLNHCVKQPANCVQYNLTIHQCTLCQHGYYLSNGFCMQCIVQQGTLQNCRGLCPIDYYIQDLLAIKTSFDYKKQLSIASLFFLLVILY